MVIEYPHKCPRCKRVKANNREELNLLFGLRKMHKNDKQKVPQSQCKKCRSKPPVKKAQKKKSKK